MGGNPQVGAVAVDPDGRIWLGAASRLAAWDGGDWVGHDTEGANVT